MAPNPKDQKRKVLKDEETREGQPNLSRTRSLSIDTTMHGRSIPANPFSPIGVAVLQYEALTPSLPSNIENMTAEEVREFEKYYENYVGTQRAQEVELPSRTPPTSALLDISRTRLSDRNPSTEQDFVIFPSSYISSGSPPDTQYSHQSPNAVPMHLQSPIHHQRQQRQPSHQQDLFGILSSNDEIGLLVSPIGTHHLSPPLRSGISHLQPHSSTNHRFSPIRPQSSQPSNSNSSHHHENQRRNSRKEEKNKPGRPREHYPHERDINNVIKNDKSHRYQSLPPIEQTKKAKERLANNYAVNRSRQKKFVTGQEVLNIISGLMERNNSAYPKFLTWKHEKNGKNIIETLRDLLPKEPNTGKGKGQSKKSLAEAEEAEDEETEDEEEYEEIYEEGRDSQDDNDYQPPPPPPPPPPSSILYPY